ncbi:MAG: LPO_1073/Vpar_1526 family protein [Pseudobdellovibrionaceae bacterium]
MSDTTQKTKAGDNSVIVQAGIVNMGSSINDIREICQLIWDTNFPKLQQEAAKVACARAEDLISCLMEGLGKDRFTHLDHFKWPRVQNDLFEAQKGFALSDGNNDLKLLLVDCVSKAIEEDEFSFNSVIFSEAIKTIPKLRKNHFQILAILYFFYRLQIRATSLDIVITRTEEEVGKIDILNADCSQKHMMLLEYLNCIKVTPFQNRLENIFRMKYPGFFSNGLDQSEMDSKFQNNVPKELFMPCVNDSSKIQVRFLNEDALKFYAPNYSWTEGEIVEIKKLIQTNLQPENEVRLKLEQYPLMKDILKVWDKDLAINQMTSVGQAIAHTYLSMITKLGAEFSL